MTWTIRTRGDSTALVLSEYYCPEHGVVEITVRRPVPEEWPCLFCDRRATWTPSAVTLHQPAFVSTNRGPSEEKPHPYVLDTEPLADGKVTMAEFRRQREAMWCAADADADLDRPRKVYSK